MRLALLSVLTLALLAGCRLEPRQSAPDPAAAGTPVPTAPTQTASASDVTVYVTEWCPYCRSTQEYLDEIGVEYTAVDIESSPEAYAEYQGQGGQGGIPLVVIGDTKIEGYSIPAFDAALDRAGL